MKFVGTRGGEKVNGAQAVVQGLAANGGLFVPEKFPVISEAELEEMLSMSYPERAHKVLSKYFNEYDSKELLSALESAYEKFEGDPAPLVKLDDGVYMLELWHGPTCAFEDISLTVLPYLLKKGCEIAGVKEEVLVLAATSGDTGKAALDGFKDSEGVRVMVFYPVDGVSKIQKLHMCTQDGNNVNVVGVKGSFDDCQAAVKEIFASAEYGEKLKEKGVVLASANTVNFGRLAPQIAYYFSAYLDMVSSGQIEMGEKIDFTVPTGNFGNALAGYYALKMGLPIRRLHCASNLNNVLCDFFKTGVYDMNRELVKTTSPSMDILLSSNLERLIFEISGRNSKLTAKRMTELKVNGKYEITPEELKEISEIFDGGFANEDTCVEAMYNIFEEAGYTMDTHTGCAMKVAYDWFEKNKKDETDMIIVSTANPYKFPQDVLYAVTGNDVKDSFKGIKRLHAATAMVVPKCLKDLKDKTPRFTTNVSVDKIFNEILNFISK